MHNILQPRHMCYHNHQLPFAQNKRKFSSVFVNIAFSGFFGILIRSLGDSHTLAHAMECLFYMKKCSRRTTRCCRWLLLLVVCVCHKEKQQISETPFNFSFPFWHSFSYFFVCIPFGGPLSTLEANGSVVNVVNVAT